MLPKDCKISDTIMVIYISYHRWIKTDWKEKFVEHVFISHRVMGNKEYVTWDFLSHR